MDRSAAAAARSWARNDAQNFAGIGGPTRAASACCASSGVAKPRRGHKAGFRKTARPARTAFLSLARSRAATNTCRWRLASARKAALRDSEAPIAAIHKPNDAPHSCGCLRPLCTRALRPLRRPRLAAALERGRATSRPLRPSRCRATCGDAEAGGGGGGGWVRDSGADDCMVGWRSAPSTPCLRGEGLRRKEVIQNSSRALCQRQLARRPSHVWQHAVARPARFVWEARSRELSAHAQDPSRVAKRSRSGAVSRALFDCAAGRGFVRRHIPISRQKDTRRSRATVDKLNHPCEALLPQGVLVGAVDADDHEMRDRPRASRRRAMSQATTTSPCYAANAQRKTAANPPGHGHRAFARPVPVNGRSFEGRRDRRGGDRTRRPCPSVGHGCAGPRSLPCGSWRCATRGRH